MSPQKEMAAPVTTAAPKPLDARQLYLLLMRKSCLKVECEWPERPGRRLPPAHFMPKPR